MIERHLEDWLGAWPGSGYEVVAEGVFTYRVNDDGKIVALRAYWELAAATRSARKI